MHKGGLCHVSVIANMIEGLKQVTRHAEFSVLLTIFTCVGAMRWAAVWLMGVIGLCCR